MDGQPIGSLSIFTPIFVPNASVGASFGLPEAYPGWNASVGTRPGACPPEACYDAAARSRFWGMLAASFRLEPLLQRSVQAL